MSSLEWSSLTYSTTWADSIQELVQILLFLYCFKDHMYRRRYPCTSSQNRSLNSVSILFSSVCSCALTKKWSQHIGGYTWLLPHDGRPLHTAPDPSCCSGLMSLFWSACGHPWPPGLCTSIRFWQSDGVISNCIKLKKSKHADLELTVISFL